MDELINLNEERLSALDVFISQKKRVAEAYNKKVKTKVLFVRDYVRKVIFPIDKKDRALEKWLTKYS